MISNAFHTLQLIRKDFFNIKRNRNIIFLVTMIYFAILFYCNSWIGDDAFISMRVIDNLVHGYGLVWNTGERVQAFSHPLWLLLVTIIYLVIKDPYITLYTLSLLVSMISVFLILKYFTKQYKLIVIIGLILTSSMSFIDFSSSGLENPLSHLLLIIFLIMIFCKPDFPKRMIAITFIASLSAVTRLDSILIYLPILIYENVKNKNPWKTKLMVMILGFSPLWIWLIFSTIYYGFPFPNTFYAKFAIRNLSINWYISHGFHYFINFIKWDLISFLVIILAIAFTIFEHKGKNLMIMAGGILYMLYVLYIGGDFMSGRFFSVVFLLSLILLTDVNFGKIIPGINKISFKYFVLLCVFFCFVSQYPPILIRLVNVHWIFDEYYIANEKYYYYNKTNCQNYIFEKSLFDWVDVGLDMKNSGERVFIFSNIGFAGYYAGPDIYIIDGYALSDPLLARLPTYENCRIGHFARNIPDGYEKTVNDYFENQIVNKSLHMYYDKLSILIHDPIFSEGRMMEIYNFATGKYDYLLDLYLDPHKIKK